MVQSETSENPEENFSPNFKPGMSATVDIETKTAKNVVSVPIQAVTVRDFAKDKKDRKSKAEDTTNAEERSSEEVDDNLIIKKEDIRKVVFIVEEGIAVRYEVETGISDNTHTQILSGVNAGDEIVIGSYRTLSKNLTNGEKVKVDNNSSTFASVN
mgnify:FL=1